MSPGSDDYDDVEERGRGRGFRTVTAVIVLALIGTVGAFGYRIIFGGPSSSAPPPVIRANPEPAKVPPPTAGTDTQSKSSYERVGDRAQGERVVSREEAPVDIKDVARPGVGRSPPQQQSPENQSTAAAAPPSGPIAPSAMGEPKKVRTVTIRPSATDGNAQSSLTPPAAATAPPAPPPRAAPTQLAPPTQLAAPVQQRPQVQPQQRAPAAAPVQSSRPPANAPLSLNEDSVLTLPRTLNEPPAAAQPRQAPAQRPATPQRSAAVAAAPPPPQPLAQAAAKGGYLVQVSSQRSEADAQAALRNLQAKYPNVLGGQPATVRRAELGARGVFFRAMIGPYASREQATQVCSSLKAAGGDCLVQGN
jgi:cell division septation protein DedD